MLVARKVEKMGRHKKQFTNDELRKINSAGFHCKKNWCKVAEYLNVARRTLYQWRKIPAFVAALEAGIRRFHRVEYRKLDMCPDEQEQAFNELEQQLNNMSFDDFEIVPREGYIIEIERIELENGGYKEIIRQKHAPLPSLKELVKGMKRKNGIYQF